VAVSDSSSERTTASPQILSRAHVDTGTYVFPCREGTWLPQGENQSRMTRQGLLQMSHSAPVQVFPSLSLSLERPREAAQEQDWTPGPFFRPPLQVSLRHTPASSPALQPFGHQKLHEQPFGLAPASLQQHHYASEDVSTYKSKSQGSTPFIVTGAAFPQPWQQACTSSQHTPMPSAMYHSPNHRQTSNMFHHALPAVRQWGVQDAEAEYWQRVAMIRAIAYRKRWQNNDATTSVTPKAPKLLEGGCRSPPLSFQSGSPESERIQQVGAAEAFL
jgi:hypothetical protein